MKEFLRCHLVGLALSLFGCSLPDIPLAQPELAIAPEPACFMIPPYAPGRFGWNHRDAKYPQAFQPCYDPTNSEKVVYIKRDIVNTFVHQSLHRLNLRTRQRQALAPNMTV
jgi:hypothetical protein